MSIKDENKERERLKREKLAGFFLDMAKLTFTAMVLGGVVPMFGGSIADNWSLVLAGVAMTLIFALCGYRILK